MPTIELRRVDKSYGGGAGMAVSQLDLAVGDGEFMCLLGPSGCGKTTTLRMIAGLEHLTAGEIAVGDRVVDSVAAGVFVPPERRQMGLVFQSYALWPHLTIERNTDFGLRLRKVPKAEREARVDKVMRTLGIEQYRDRYPSQLSGGQQQRVALARMLAVNPEVLLLDEPLSNLDSRLRLEMRAELQRLHEEFGTTIVFVTHDQWEAMTLATTIAVMNRGRLQQVGTPAEIYGRPANRFVAEFVGNPPINLIDVAAGKGALLDEARAFFAGRGGALADAAALGIRPETLHVSAGDAPAPGGSFSARGKVSGVLMTGGSWIVEAMVGNDKMFTVAHEAPPYPVGAPVTLWAEPAALHVFDSAGTRLEAADAALGPAVN